MLVMAPRLTRAQTIQQVPLATKDLIYGLCH
jgi:hypothetical protein